MYSRSGFSTKITVIHDRHSDGLAKAKHLAASKIL